MCCSPQGPSSLSAVLTKIPLHPCGPLAIYQKMCQVVKKMSNVKKSNTWTMEEVQKKIDIMRFTHIDVNFDVKYDGDQKPSKYP